MCQTKFLLQRYSKLALVALVKEGTPLAIQNGAQE